MLQHYFQIAIRHLLKYKTQNLISIVGLAVCLLCFSICMYCSRFFLSIDQCFENHDHIADIVLKSSNGEFFSGTPATVFEQLQDIPGNCPSTGNSDLFTNGMDGITEDTIPTG